MEKTNNRKIGGYAMAGIGFLMILISAVNYLFDLGFKSSAFSIMGIVFLAIGTGTVRKFNKN